MTVVAVVTQVVAHWTTDQEVQGSIPAGRWAFFLFLLYPIRSVSLIRSLVEVQHNWISSIKCLASLLEAKKAQYAHLEQKITAGDSEKKSLQAQLAIKQSINEVQIPLLNKNKQG